MIQVISDLVQKKSFVQSENHLDYLIWAKRMTHLKRLGRLVSVQETTTERSHICVSQQYRCHMKFEAEWEDMRRTNNSRFSITVLRVGSAVGVNGPVIFLAKGTKVHPRLRGNNSLLITTT